MRTAPRVRRSRVLSGICLLGLGSALAAGGCAAKRAAAAAARQREEAAAATRHAESRARLELLDPPVARGLDVGLDSALLISQTNQGELASALAPLLTKPVPLDPGTVQLWRENGLRIVSIPRSRWPDLSEQLRISAAAQRQWVAQSPNWIEVVRGAERGGSAAARTIALDSERLALPPGRLRLLARTWIAPRPVDVAASERWASPGVGQVVRPGSQPESAGEGPAEAQTLAVPQMIVELALQSQDLPRDRNERISLTAPRGTVEEIDDGLTFWRLQARLRFSSSDDLLLVVAERPDADWTVNTPRSVEPASDDAAAVPGPGEVVRAASRTTGASPTGRPEASEEPSSAGPAARVLPTLGEVLFGADIASSSAATSDAGKHSEDTLGGDRFVRQPGRPARAVLLLIPRLPDRFELIPR